MKRTVNPADGERRAMVGYVPQYQLAADFVYDALSEGTLEWIRIADPEAGQVDDIQIAAAGLLDAFQVKWSGTVRSVSFQFLIRDEKSQGRQPKPNLMRQLAEGWLVVASKDAARLISRTIGKATKLGAVLRQYHDRDEKRLVQDFAVCRKNWDGN